MPERIELPPTLQGDEKSQLHQLWSYLYQMSESLNNNLQAIGSNDLTDNDRKIMQKIIQDAGESAPQFSEMETLKSLIIKTADFVQTSLQEYRLKLLGESVASGQFGRYVRQTGLDVEVTPEGIKQNYSFEEVVQGLKEFSVNAKNCIKTGLLRMEDELPIYGVAIGKDIVTFAQDGTETYHDEKKVLELTADVISFWQNGVKIASYTGTRISFWFGNVEMFYIENGKIYCAGDLQLAAQKTFTGDLNAAGGSFAGYVGIRKPIKDQGDSEVGQMIIEIGEQRESPAPGPNPGKVTMQYSMTKAPEEEIGSSWYYGGLRNYLNDYTSGLEQEAYYDFGHQMGFWRAYSPQPTLAPGLYPEPGAYFSATGYQGKMALGSSERPWRFANIRYLDSKNIYTDAITAGAYNNTSSREVKQNISDLPENGEAIDQLRPVSYEYKAEPGRRRFGLIHEEAAEVLPEICTGIGENDPERRGINYVDLVPLLLKEIQSLRARVAQLESRTGGE